MMTQKGLESHADRKASRREVRIALKATQANEEEEEEAGSDEEEEEADLDEEELETEESEEEI